MTFFFLLVFALFYSVVNEQQQPVKILLHESSLLLFNHSTFQRHVTSIPFFLKPCLKVTLIYPPVTYRKKPIRDFGDPRFMFCVYGFDLSDRIWLVSIVLRIYPYTRRSMGSSPILFQGYP